MSNEQSFYFFLDPHCIDENSKVNVNHLHRDILNFNGNVFHTCPLSMKLLLTSRVFYDFNNAYSVYLLFKK